jgi:hypothetical protein
VVAVAGRTADRARHNAAELAATLGHDVATAADVRALCAQDIDALLIASPAEAHLEALEAALEHGLACLCEKPIVGLAEADRGLACLQRFAAAKTVFVENAQWPLILPVLDALHGSARTNAAKLSMGLSPMHGGAEAMVSDSLPHLLSLLLELVPQQSRSSVHVRNVAIDSRDPLATLANAVVEVGFEGGSLRAELHLQQVPLQPRPFWFAVDGRRADRRIGKDYALSFVGNGQEVARPAPLFALVAQFVELAKGSGSPQGEELRARLVAEAAVRLRLYAGVLARLFGGTSAI